MWVAKLSLKYQDDIFTGRTEKYRVNFYAYPLTHYEKKGGYYFVVMGILDGEEENKMQFIKNLKTDKRVKTLDARGDVLTVLITYPLREIRKADMNTYYNPSLIHIEPALNSMDGREYWTIGSYEKEALSSLIDSAIDHHEGKLLSMVNVALDNFSLITLAPKISAQQRNVILAAFKQGYYSYPRKTEIKKLAEMLHISYATCQEHLRKAEIALLPNMLKKL